MSFSVAYSPCGRNQEKARLLHEFDVKMLPDEQIGDIKRFTITAITV